MNYQLMNLIENDPIGSTLKSRGGVRNRWRHFVFLKIKKNTVWTLDAATYKSFADKKAWERGFDKGRRICVCNPDGVHFILDERPKGEYSTSVLNHPVYYTWDMDAFFSLNLLYGVYMRFIDGTPILQLDGKRCLVQRTMSFNWKGELTTPITKKAKVAYQKWDRASKDRKNALARARYAQNKAERIFKKHKKNGTLSEWDAKEVFNLQNAQVRQQAIEEVGLARVLSNFETKVLDKSRHYELIQVLIPSFSTKMWGSLHPSREKWATYLKMVNPSTGEIHLEGVPLKTDNNTDYIPEETVKGALAWRDGENGDPADFNSRVDRVTTASNWKYNKPNIIT